MKLSIIIPAYNEELRLGRMLDAYMPFFSEVYGQDFEVIIVVNGSRDCTEDVARRFEKKYSRLRCIIEARPIGKGGALMLGMKTAEGDLIGYVDADGATPPEAFQKLVERLGDADAIIASRWLPGADVFPRQPLSRRIASRIFNFLVRKLFKVSITDTQCGAKLMTKRAARTVLPSLGLTRWAFDVDLLFQLRRHGFSMVESPTVWHDISGSQVRIIGASIEMFLAIVRLRLLHSPLKFVLVIYDNTLGRIIHLKP